MWSSGVVARVVSTLVITFGVSGSHVSQLVAGLCVRRGSNEGYTPSRVDAARADDGTLIFSLVVRTWIDALARRRSCLRVIARTWPFWRWPDRRRSASWPAGTR